MIPNAAWRATEVNLGVICANAPIARPLYLFYHGRLSALRSPNQSGGSRLWPGSSKRSRGIQKMSGKRDSHWLAMAEGEQDEVAARDRATVRDAFD